MAEAFSLGPNRVSILARGEDTNGGYSVVEWVMAPPPAPGPPLHRHEREDESIVLLAGELETTVDGRSRRMRPGELVFVPRGTWHTLANPGPEPARFLVVLSPPGFERFWQETASLLEQNPAPEAAEVLALQRRHGMETAGGARRRFG